MKKQKQKFVVGDEVELVVTHGMIAKAGAKAIILGVEDYLIVSWKEDALSNKQKDGGYDYNRFKLTSKTKKSKKSKMKSEMKTKIESLVLELKNMKAGG